MMRGRIFVCTTKNWGGFVTLNLSKAETDVLEKAERLFRRVLAIWRRVIDMVALSQSEWDRRLRRISNVKDRFDLESATILATYLVSYRGREKARGFERSDIESMLVINVIGLTQTVQASPDLLAPKKDRPLWFCADYRIRYAVRNRNLYQLQTIEECMDFLEEAQVFSMIDEKSAYKQIEVRPSNCEKTAFTS